MIKTYEQLTQEQEAERINGKQAEKYREELYKRYEQKNEIPTVYQGFKMIRPDGQTMIYTIHYRTDNARPYAIYLDGRQTPLKTYIMRSYCEKVLKPIQERFKKSFPLFQIVELYGKEIIT